MVPPKHPPKWSFLVGKPMVVGYHHFRKPPYNVTGSSPSKASPPEMSSSLPRPSRLIRKFAAFLRAAVLKIPNMIGIRSTWFSNIFKYVIPLPSTRIYEHYIICPLKTKKFILNKNKDSGISHLLAKPNKYVNCARVAGDVTQHAYCSYKSQHRK